MRKTTALLMAYCFLATSAWSLNSPGQGLHRGTSGTTWQALRNPLAGLTSALAGNHALASGNERRMPVPKIFTNLRDLHASMAAAQATGGATATISFFGPQEYVRTTGDPNTYVTTVTVPAWVANPFTLHIQSGEADGSFRVSSATVSINNVPVAVPADFNQNVFTLDRNVTLTPQTTLTVTLASKPGSYLRINLIGANGDITPPAVTITAPTAAINTPQAHFDIHYQDIPGTGETAASGVNNATLKVLIDGVDRTSLFTKFTDEAIADLPSSLALAAGPHTVTASVQDNAGNTGTATAQFQVDTTPPVLQIQQPAAGNYLNSTTPQIVLSYSDNFALDPASLKVIDNGTDVSSAFTKTATGASGAPTLSQGGNEIVATIKDQAGNATSASVSFNVDTTAPKITIVHPAPGSEHGSGIVEFQVQYSDDQAIDLNSLVLTIDGNPLVINPTITGVSGTVTLGNSASHVLNASIKDKAGNTASDSSSFIVDTTLPNIHIVQPSLNAILNNATPQIQVDYSESISGVNTQTFKASVDGTDVTTLFLVQASSASATLQTPLADGPHTLSAQIASNAGNVGSSSNPILIDTIKPQLSIISPAGPVNTSTPLGTAQYSDSGSGIDPNSVQVTLDGTDITGTLGVSSSSASGALATGAGLNEGPHQFAVKVADKAGNITQSSSSFLVDVTAPAVAFSSPANDSFINNTQPAITLTYSDSGSGIDLSSIHVFLQQGSVPETEITSLLTLSASQASGTISASSPLVPGTYHLRAVVADKAGNTAPAQAAFAVDTTPPTYLIQSPAANAFLNTATPAFTVSYQDDASGVDTSKFILLVDGVDRTNRLTFTPTGASGNLLAADTLAEGSHQVSVTVVDRAGNAAPIVPQPFLVDTIAPVLNITAPLASTFTNNNHVPIAITYSDSGSGIDVTTFQLLIDGVDHTPEFTVTLTGASGSPATALLDGAHLISATIKDLAGNPVTATTAFTVDTTPLQLNLAQPTNGTFTNANSITVSGTVTGFPPVSVLVDGVSVLVSGNAFTTDVLLGPGPTQAIQVSASDPSGASTSTSVTVGIDRVKPTIIGSISPLPNAAHWNNTPVVVNFLCADDNSGVASCTGPVPVTSEGANQIVTGTVVDKAGNTASTSVPVNIDSTPPVITATPSPAAINGWNNTNVNVTFFCSDSLSGVATCPAPTLVTTEGANQLVTGQATDNAGNTAQVSSVSLNIDKTAPTIVQLSTPDHISAVHGGQVSVTVTDNFTVAQVVISVNGTPLGTFVSAPFQANLQVPAGAKPGDTLTVTAVATDEAGNTQTASRGVSVTADGVIVGQVLSDATGLPIQGAIVQLISANGLTDTSDAKGRYSFQASDTHLFVAATNSGSTTVEREIFVQPGAGTVAVDARLTPLAAPRPVGSAGGTLTSGSISIAVPAASVPDGTNFQLTALSGQGLPGLLPLGWSPVAAFDLRASASVSGLPAVVSQLPGVVSDLAIYDPALHAWTLVASNLPSINGSCSFTVPAPGAYALVVPDTTTPPIPIPDPGSPLTGIAVQAIDPAASSSGSLNPPMLPPAGGTATATLGVQSPIFAPSGTIIQANVLETFTLSSGAKVSEETRSEDILLYNALAPANSTMGAKFPVTPSRQYTLTQLVTGKVHLDILAGREGVRGQPGGNDPVTLSDGTSTLSVPGGALSQDTAISVQSTSLEDFVPTSGSMAAIQEVLVDFSGETLNTPAQLSIASTGLNPNDTFLLTQVQRINGVPYMVAVALAQINGQSLSSITSPGLPGVTQGGEYVFYDISVPVGFVQGTTSSTAGAVSALVLTDSLQIAGISGSNGHYIVPALAGTANLKASAPNTSLAGTASAQVIAGQTVAVNIALAGTVTRAAVNPADGTLGVPTSTIITISTSAPLNPQSIVQGNLSLVKGPASAPGAPVPLQPFVLSTSGTTLTFAPVSNLDPATQYTIQVSGLADASGGAIAVPTSSFTTKASAPLNFDPNAITFAFPDQNGNIHVSAPAGSLPPGTRILIIDQGNAVVVSFTAFNDGSVSGDFPGTINDVLQITVTDPNGATISFTRSQFVAPDGSVAVGPGGGTITGPGGVGMIIPAGALDQGAVFSLQPLGQDAFPQLPPVPGATFGGGMQITAPSMPFFKQEVKLAFPKPVDAPDGAFYYVYRQITDQNGKVYFETIDHAFVQGTGSAAQVVTASPPHCGFRNFYGNFNTAAAASFSPTLSAIQKTFFMWTFDPNQPGVASMGLIVGKALQASAPGSGQLTFHAIQGATVWLGASTKPSLFMSVTSDTCGEFTIFDPQFGGGPRTVTAQSPDGKTTIQLTANEVNGVQVDDATYDITAGLEFLYLNIGRVNFTFPSIPAPAPPPIDVRLYTLDQNFHRVPTTSIIQSGAPLVIAIKTSLTVTGASINGQQLTVVTPDYLDDVNDPTAPLNARANDNSSTDSLHRYIAQTPDAYTLTVTALSPSGGPPVSVSKGFLVVAAGGSNNVVTPNRPPLVLSTVPLQNAGRVDVSSFPQVTFSEPVTNVPGNVTLVGTDNDAPRFIMIGVRPDGTVANPVGPLDAITSLTIQPESGLKFNMGYTLTLTGGIKDQNNPPFSLMPYVLQFTTVGGQRLDNGSDTSTFTRLAVIGQRAYGGKFINVALSGLDVLDISDPTRPKDTGTAFTFPGRVIDAAGLKSSPVTRCRVELDPGTSCPLSTSNAPLVALAANVGGTAFSMPSNIWLFDVSNRDQPVRVGALSVSSSATQDGALLRIFMKDGFIFASTFNKGLQVIDVQQAINEFQQTPPVQFGQAMTTEGDGFALDAVVNTIPPLINVPAGQGVIAVPATMMDVKAGDFATAPPDPNNPDAQPLTQTLIVATGHLPLVVADPGQGGLQAILYPPTDVLGTGLSQAALSSSDGQSRLQQGTAIALGSVSVVNPNGSSVQEPVAVAVGNGTFNGTPQVPVLVVVDMTDPRHPVAQGFVKLVDNSGALVYPTDVILRDTIAVIGTGKGEVLLVDISDPAFPLAAGQMDGSYGTHLALTDDNLLVTSSVEAATGGVRIGSFRSTCGALRASFSAQPVPADIDITNQLGWSLHASVSKNDGLTVSNVRLGRRHMANQMSLPYLNLNFLRRDINQNIPARCELTPNSDQTGYVGDSRSPNGALRACDILLTSRSRLVDFKSEPSDGKTFALQAKYLLDRLDGDPNDPLTPSVPDSCLLVTQRYQFEKVNSPADGRPFEPNGALPTGKFFPTVEYQYFSDRSTLNSITMPQRMQFDARDINDDPSPKAPSNATLLTCDPNNPLISPLSCSTGFPGAGILHGENPLQEEQFVRVIEGGQIRVFNDFSLTHPGIFASVDNFHQSPQPVDTPDQSIDLPGLGFPGCPGCVHIHWRWGTFLEPDNFLGQLVGVDPTFKGNDGNLFIPLGSNQDVDVAIVRAKSDEQHPLDFKVLANGEPLLPSVNPQPVFWYAGTGHQPSDKFFIHGGAFSNLYANKLDTPSNGLISINVEHSNDIQWTVSVYGITFTSGPTPTPIFTIEDLEAGTLNPQQNFINLVNPVSKPYALVIDLTDNVTGALSHNYYVFAVPTDKVIEP